MEKPTSIKDKNALAYIDFLEEKLSTFTKSPYVNSYLSLKRMVDRGNQQLAESADSEIDFDSDKFKAISKFVSLQKGYIEQMDYYRTKMLPLDQRELDEQLKQNAGIAEKVALKKHGKN